MSTTIPNLQVIINANLVRCTSIDVQLEGGKVRVPLIDGTMLYADDAKALVLDIDAPPFPDGFQVNAFGLIVDGQDVECMIDIPGGQVWKGKGVVMSAGFSQSAGSATSQKVAMEFPLNNKPN